MRTSTEAIVVHCTASPWGVPKDVAQITAEHVARGFSTIGYHWLIGLKGEIWQGRAPQNSVGAHVAGFNNRTVAVSYVGGLGPDGVPKDTRNALQLVSIEKKVRELHHDYPEAVILGHRDLSTDLNHDGVIEKYEWIKVCPCFEAGPWAKSIGLPGGAYKESSSHWNGTFYKI